MTGPAEGPDANRIDLSRPAPARRYDKLLGGKDNFRADRDSAAQLAQELPSIAPAAQELRRFMERAVHHLAANCGVRQFLDIGCGFPHPPNVHEIAQAVDPASRVVYVDPDPLVAVHARALFTSHPQGAIEVLDGRLEDIDAVLADTAIRKVLDFSQPIAALALAVLHFIPDDQQARQGIEAIHTALLPGSWLAVSHVTFDLLSAEHTARLTKLSEPDAGHGPFRARSHTELTRLLDGWRLEPPGLVSVVDWRPDEHPQPQITAVEAVAYGVIAAREVANRSARDPTGASGAGDR